MYNLDHWPYIFGIIIICCKLFIIKSMKIFDRIKSKMSHLAGGYCIYAPLKVALG